MSKIMNLTCKIISLGSKSIIDEENNSITNRPHVNVDGQDAHGSGYVKFTGWNNLDEVLDKIHFAHVFEDPKIKYKSITISNDLRIYDNHKELYFIICVKSKSRIYNNNILTSPWSRSFRLSFAGFPGMEETLLVVKAGDLVQVDGYFHWVRENGELSVEQHIIRS